MPQIDLNVTFVGSQPDLDRPAQKWRHFALPPGGTSSAAEAQIFFLGDTVIKRTVSALILAALVALPSTSTALAATTNTDPNVRLAGKIEKAVDFLDAGIAWVSAGIERIDGRLADDPRARERQRLEMQRQELEEQQSRLQQARQSFLEWVCGPPYILAMLVPQCFSE